MKYKRLIYDYIGITVGTIIMAWGMNAFVASNKLISGGISGLSNIIHITSRLPLGVIIFAFSMAVVIFCFKDFGKKAGIKTIYCILLYTALIDLTSEIIGPFTDNLFLASAFGGIVWGVGLGIVLNCGGSMGSTDLIARALNRRFKQLSVGSAIFVMDVIPAILGAIIFGKEMLLYSITLIFCTAKIADMVQGGMNIGKQITIITTKRGEISAYIISQMGRSVTFWEGKGAYSGQSRDILLCVLKAGELGRFRREIMRIDPEVFMTIGEVREVYGKTFERESTGV